jgi:hypothetical protein
MRGGEGEADGGVDKRREKGEGEGKGKEGQKCELTL